MNSDYQFNKSINFLAVPLCINSFASLMFETLLLKQLSFLIGSWNYILSIVLCSFMIGAGTGALLALSKKIRVPFSYLAILQGVSVIITSVVLLRLDIILKVSSSLIFIGIILSPTFIFFGYLFSTILTHIRSKRSTAIRFIYSADLVGAALGGMLTAFIVLPLIGVNKSSILCVILFSVSALLFGGKRGIRKYKLVYFFIGGLLLLSFFNIDPLIEKYRNIENTPLHKMLKTNGELLYTGWSPLQRIDIVKFQNSFVITYDGFPWTSFETLSNSNGVESMLKDLGPRYMKGLYPFLHNPRNILIIGVGAGPDVAYSKVWLDEWRSESPDHSGRIVGIEIDSLVVDLLKNRFKNLNNNVFNDPDVEIIVDDGRHFLETASEEFDLIYYPGVDTPFAFTSVYGVNPYLRAENYLYTFEGLMTAYERLSEDGALIITVGTWSPHSFETLNIIIDKIQAALSREARLIATFSSVLKEKGISEWEDYIETVAYGFSHLKDNSQVEVMIKMTKKPVDPGIIKHIPEQHNIQYPFYHFDKSEIIRLSKMYMPISDDQPFYYNFPLTAIPKIISQPLLFSFILLIFYLLYSLAFLKVKNKCANLGISGLLFMYFACIGISYMTIELSYVQKSIMFFRNSFLGTAILVPLFLLLSGIGSILVIKLYSKFNRKIFFILVLLPAYNFLLPGIINLIHPVTGGLPIYLKVAVFSFLIFPVGFILGTFFPIGFIMSGKLEPNINISWLYAIDIIGSIAGILVGVCLPIKIGYIKSIYCLSYLFFIQVIIVFFLQRFAGSKSLMRKTGYKRTNV